MIATELFGARQLAGAGLLLLSVLWVVACVLSRRDDHSG